MKIAITGSSGVIGTALTRHLQLGGHTVVRLVRRAPSSAAEAQWDPARRELDQHALSGVEAIVNLAGAGVGDKRWTDSYKQQILSSRVDSTLTIAAAAARLDAERPVLVSGSAIGFYGDTGKSPVDESGPKGSGFLADVVQQWEAAAAEAESAGVAVSYARTGLVVSRTGGAWGKMWPIFKMGAGGRLGDGTQMWSFISLRDEVRALTLMIDKALTGPVNLVAPAPLSNADATAAFAKHLNRPAFMPVPGFALKAALGEFSSEILCSQAVIPGRLKAEGFTWLDPTMDAALAAAEAAA